MPPRRKRLSWLKRIAFNLLLFLATYFLVEALSLACLVFTYGSPSALNAARSFLARVEPLGPSSNFQVPTVVHPYLGAVQQPIDDSKVTENKNRFRINEFGFTDDDLPIHKRSADRVIIAILGGSVARQFSLNAADQLAEELSRFPEFAGQTFKFVRLANNGYKQPQQLMVLNYLLSLGAEFDYVINLDGFNEAVLPGKDNVPFGVYSAYPRDWGKMIAGNANPDYVRIVGYVSYLRFQQRTAARWAASFPLRYCCFAQLVWNVRNEQLSQAINQQSETLSRYVQHGANYCRLGPPEHFNSRDEMFQHCTELWSRSSLLLHQLCQARGIRYFHFLQPNQYLPGSKPIGSEEAKVALLQANQFGIEICYPLMKTEGQRLIAAGVAFTDLTNLFADHPEPLYVDVCCHLSGAGDSLIAHAIADRIGQVAGNGR